MVLVAVAGGTSKGLGRSIVLALKEHADHTPVVLSRRSSTTPQWLSDLGTEVRKVDYLSEESLLSALKGVSTVSAAVITVFLATDGTWACSQVSLLNAALKAGVTRFAPAEFGCGPVADKKIALLAPQTAVWDACNAATETHPGFEWAGFHVGLFMNYLGNGCAREEEALAGKSDDGEFLFYMRAMKARIPLREDGGIPRITMTEIGDIGRFVAAACSLPAGTWNPNLSMVGDTLRMDQVVEAIESVRGRKMDITYRTPTEIRMELEKERSPMKQFWLELEEMYTRDAEDEGVLRPTLNQLCPNVRPISIREYLEKFWSG